MERAEYLVLKMLELLRRNESKAQMMGLLKDIQEEIERSFPSEEPITAIATAVPTPIVEVPEVPAEEKIVEVLQINEEDIDWEQEETTMVLQVDEDDEDDEDEDNDSDSDSDSDEKTAVDSEKEFNITQTLFSKFLKPPPEDALLNPDFQEEDNQSRSTFAQNNTSETASPLSVPGSNEKQVVASSNELLNRFTESPIRDLKKAIGINDRYRFIHELFKGDENMYERSLKTINDFSIYPEAEFWVRRELKIKLGWNTDDELVQVFDQLVRRRFS